MKTRCFADFSFSLTTSEPNLYLLYDHFLQDRNERAVADMTGSEKGQDGASDSKAC